MNVMDGSLWEWVILESLYFILCGEYKIWNKREFLL